MNDNRTLEEILKNEDRWKTEIVERSGYTAETVARWCTTFNSWEWPKDFPVKEPEGFSELTNEEKFNCLLFRICSEGVEASCPPTARKMDWLTRECEMTEEAAQEFCRTNIKSVLRY